MTLEELNYANELCEKIGRLNELQNAMRFKSFSDKDDLTIDERLEYISQKRDKLQKEFDDLFKERHCVDIVKNNLFHAVQELREVAKTLHSGYGVPIDDIEEEEKIDPSEYERVMEFAKTAIIHYGQDEKRITPSN